MTRAKSASAGGRRFVPLAAGLAALLAAFAAQAQLTEVLPGSTQTLDPYGSDDYENCATESSPFSYTVFNSGGSDTFNSDIPIVRCDTNTAASGNIRVRAGQALAFALSTGATSVVLGDDDPIRYGNAIGRIGKSIRIPALGEGESGAQVLDVQIAAEVSWSGLLWNRRLVIPSWTQVVGTLQVRDLTTGLVVASNTFLNERSDLESNLPTSFSVTAVNQLFGWTSVRNTSGVDLTAELLRGRDYRVEIEARCEDLSLMTLLSTRLFDSAVTGWYTGGGCFFTNADVDPLGIFPILPSIVDPTFYEPGGGFQVSPLVVTVQDDIEAGLAALLTMDSDGDGIIDSEDACPNSDLSLTVVIDGCDSGVENFLKENGCTIKDEINHCAEEAGNHGQFVSCVARLTNDKDSLTEEGTDLWSKRGPIQSCAAQADLP